MFKNDKEEGLGEYVEEKDLKSISRFNAIELNEKLE